MQRIKIGADDVGIKERHHSRPYEYGDLAEWILGEHTLIAHGRARFLMGHRKILCNADFMGEHERLAGVGGMRLVKKFHGVLEVTSGGRCACIARRVNCSAPAGRQAAITSIFERVFGAPTAIRAA